VVGILLLATALVLVISVDTDGNPLTQDFPSVVIPAVASGEVSLQREHAKEGEKQRRGRPGIDRVVWLHRAARRWKAVVRRWHRSFLTDCPV